jgi:hypothetical protein
MAKKKTNRSPAATLGPGLLKRLGRMLFSHSPLLLALTVVGFLGWGFQLCWLHYSPSIIHRPCYLVPGQQITISPPPEWINADIRGEVVRNAGLDGQLSILDDDFVSAIRSAFLLHPWIASVDRITKSYPPAVHVCLSYRRPIAVVEMSGPTGAELLPVDKLGIRLPASSYPEISIHTLPRIGNIVGRPPEGQKWDDPRVAGAAKLADQLTDLWQQFHLVDILPSARPEIRGKHRYFLFNLVTRGGTRIVWGAASQSGPPGEADFATKLKRLKQCAQRCGPLDSVRGPAVVDIRQGLVVTPRTARNTGATSKEIPSVVK